MQNDAGCRNDGEGIVRSIQLLDDRCIRDALVGKTNRPVNTRRIQTDQACGFHFKFRGAVGEDECTPLYRVARLLHLKIAFPSVDECG